MSESPRLQKTDTDEHASGRREKSRFHDNAIRTNSRKFKYQNENGYVLPIVEVLICSFMSRSSLSTNKKKKFFN